MYIYVRSFNQNKKIHKWTKWVFDRPFFYTRYISQTKIKVRNNQIWQLATYYNIIFYVPLTELNENISFCSVPPNVKCQDEPKFIVFYSTLLSLLSLFCFRCKKDKPTVKMLRNGTMVAVTQYCDTCQAKSFTWRSQPFVFGSI